MRRERYKKLCTSRYLEFSRKRLEVVLSYEKKRKVEERKGERIRRGRQTERGRYKKLCTSRRLEFSSQPGRGSVRVTRVVLSYEREECGKTEERARNEENWDERDEDKEKKIVKVYYLFVELWRAARSIVR